MKTVVVLAFVAVAAVLLMGCKRETEDAPPGSPEFEAGISAFVEDCVATSAERDLRAEFPMNARERAAICRGVTIKTLKLYPALWPQRKRSPN